jgi:ABC-type lipoprotein release transport system permease subunit
MRTLGGKKQHVYAIVIFQGLFLALIGTVLGTLAAIATTPFFVPYIASFFEFGALELTLVYIAPNILQSSIIFCSLAFLISMIPAAKAFGVSIIDAMTPLRASETKVRIRKESHPNLKLVAIGAIISLLGAIFFLMVPTLIAYLDFFFLAMIFVLLLIMMLLGFTLIIVNLIPYIERLLNAIISKLIPIFNKTEPISISKITKQKNKDLIQKTSITVSFVFIFFIINTAIVLPQLTQETFQFQYGSDIILSNVLDPENKNLDQAILDDINNLPGVFKAAPAMLNCIDLILLLNGKFESFGTDRNKTIQAADLIKYRSVEAGLVAVDPSYLEVIPTKSIEMQNQEDAFNSIFQHNNTIIISTALSEYLKLYKGDSIRLEVWDYTTNSVEIYEFSIVGVSGGLPGFWNFREGYYTAYLQPGMMVSIDTFKFLFNITNDNLYYDKILVKLNSLDEIDNVKQRISELYSESYVFVIDDPYSKIAAIVGFFNSIQIVFSIILFFAVIISIFNFYAGSLRTIREKQREFGILQTLGLRRGEARLMYFKDLMVMLLGSAFMGTLFGILFANFIKFELAYLIETPFTAYIPWNQIGIIFGLTAVLGGLGTALIILLNTKGSVISFMNRFS